MKKYRLIIILIGVIALLNIMAAIGSYFISKNIDRFNAYSTVLAEQQVALDKMSKDIIDIDVFFERFAADKKADAKVFSEATYNQEQDIAHYLFYLRKQIQLFHDGGTVKVLNATYPLAAPEGDAAVVNQRIQEIWQPLSALVGKMVAGLESHQWSKSDITIRFAADYVRKYSEILGDYFNVLKKNYRVEADKLSLQMRAVQISAVAFTVLFFAILIILGLRSLIIADKKLERAQKETADIMKTVNEGLFLIDEQLRIGDQYSAMLEDILHQEIIAGRKLNELLSGIISKQDFEVTQDFIEQLFNEDVIETLIAELNPLDKLRVYLDTGRGDKESRYLSFNFSRVYDENTGHIINVLVSVADITQQIELEKKLEQERLRHDEQIELLALTLNIPEPVLQGFIRNASASAEAVNNVLAEPVTGQRNFLNKADRIFREIHSMKGEASALGLKSFVSIAEDMETAVSALKKQTEISGEDFTKLAINLNSVMDLLKKLSEIQGQVHDKIVTGEAYATDAESAEQRQLSQLVKNVAGRNHKQVKFSLQGWHCMHQLSQHRQDKAREVIIQLLRNAVVHGIESAEARVAAHKDPAGHVQCLIEQKEQMLQIMVCDDGQGIDFEVLRQKAVAEGKLNASQLSADLPQDKKKKLEKELLKYLFVSGFSTAKQQNEDAGRGVGMDVVKNRIKELNAKLEILTDSGVSTAFIIRIPLTDSK